MGNTFMRFLIRITSSKVVPGLICFIAMLRTTDLKHEML